MKLKKILFYYNDNLEGISKILAMKFKQGHSMRIYSTNDFSEIITILFRFDDLCSNSIHIISQFLFTVKT